MPRRILITGATGNQGWFPQDRKTGSCLLNRVFAGGSVAKLLLQSPSEFQVRALTRRPESDAARALKEAGAEIVQGDLTDRTSLELAFKDCWGAFVATNFYDSVS